MPELPEVQTVVSELNRKLKNKTIKSVEVNAPKMVAVGPDVISNRRQVESNKVIKFIKLLQRQKILSVKRRAKLLIFDLTPSSVRLRRTPSPARGEGKKIGLLAHLKMTGQFIFEDKKQREKTKGLYRLINSQNAIPEQLPSKHTHVIFHFMDGSTLYFNDVRKFWYLKLVREDELDQVRELQEYGPEPLSKNFTIALFSAAAENRAKTTIKQMLMDPKVVAGIGNIYSDEILFRAKIRPDRKVSSLSEKDIKEIYKQIPIVLKQAIKAKGSSVGDFIRTDGSWGQMGKHHFVYGRGGEKCKVCSNIIKSVKLGGRTASYCPHCQR